MPTATVHIEEVSGFAGRARCFAVDPPYEGHNYVTVWVQDGYSNVTRPEVAAVPATETGAAAERSLMRRPGSYVIHGPCTTDDEFAAYCWFALQMLGQPGYDIVEPVEES